MKFSCLDTAVKRQIKASMKRIADKLIKLNADKSDSVSFGTAFNIWTSRYLCTHKGIRYYNLIPVDEELFNDLSSTMESIFIKALDTVPPDSTGKDVKYSRYYIEKPATEKQLNYARYLMNMVRNTSLPQKEYTMYEMSVIINDLKSQMKAL